MKKILMIIFIAIISIVLLALGLLYHARMTASDWGGMENPDKNMLDGNYTYVDNEKLLQRIVGDWVSEDGSYRMTYDSDYQMTIKKDDMEVLATKADFSYLQPGEVTSTEFLLESWTIKDVDQNDLGEVTSCYHSLENGEDVISLHIWLFESEKEQEDEITIQFKKSK